jgi:hypothetical protein
MRGTSYGTDPHPHHGSQTTINFFDKEIAQRTPEVNNDYMRMTFMDKSNVWGGGDALGRLTEINKSQVDKTMKIMRGDFRRTD